MLPSYESIFEAVTRTARANSSEDTNLAPLSLKDYKKKVIFKTKLLQQWIIELDLRILSFIQKDWIYKLYLISFFQ